MTSSIINCKSHPMLRDCRLSRMNHVLWVSWSISHDHTTNVVPTMVVDLRWVIWALQTHIKATRTIQTHDTSPDNSLTTHITGHRIPLANHVTKCLDFLRLRSLQVVNGPTFASIRFISRCLSPSKALAAAILNVASVVVLSAHWEVDMIEFQDITTTAQSRQTIGSSHIQINTSRFIITLI